MTKNEKAIKAQTELENKVADALSKKTGLVVTGAEFGAWLDQTPNETIEKMVKKLFTKKQLNELTECNIDVWEAMCITAEVYDGFTPGEIAMIKSALAA